MRKITYIILVILVFYSYCGISKVKIGNEFFGNLVRIASQKIIQTVNENKTIIPDLEVNFKLANLIPFEAKMQNSTFNNLTYKVNMISINHKSDDTIALKLSK